MRRKYSWKVKRIPEKSPPAATILRHGFHNRVNCAVVRAPGGQIRIKAVCSSSLPYRSFLSGPEAWQPSPGSRSADTYRRKASARCLRRWRSRTFPQDPSGSRHSNPTAALSMPSFRSLGFYSASFTAGTAILLKIVIFFRRNIYKNIGFLVCAVGIQKCSGQVYNALAAPV